MVDRSILRETLVTDVRCCARCGTDHERVTFRKFKRPVEGDNDMYTHWAMCSVSEDPILLDVKETK